MSEGARAAEVMDGGGLAGIRRQNNNTLPHGESMFSDDFVSSLVWVKYGLLSSWTRSVHFPFRSPGVPMWDFISTAALRKILCS